MPIPEPGGLLWPAVKIRMTNKWPTTIEEQMDRLGGAWKTVGDVYVLHGNPGEEPPKSVWGDAAGDIFRQKVATLRSKSVKKTGEKAQKLGWTASMFGKDIKYTKESITKFIADLESTYLILGVAGAAAGRGGSEVTGAWLDGLAKNIDEFIVTMAQRITARGVVQAGRPRPELSANGTAPGYTDPSNQPDPNAEPHGARTNETKGDAEQQRGHQRENQSADKLAKLGYEVEQNPAAQPNGTQPDFLVEGRYFDNYAPGAAGASGIYSEISAKVTDGQADRIVVNFADSKVDPATVRADLQTRTIPGLKEVIGFDQNGNPVRLYP
jgi:hypothetical protein